MFSLMFPFFNNDMDPLFDDFAQLVDGFFLDLKSLIVFVVFG